MQLLFPHISLPSLYMRQEAAQDFERALRGATSAAAVAAADAELCAADTDTTICFICPRPTLPHCFHPQSMAAGAFWFRENRKSGA